MKAPVRKIDAGFQAYHWLDNGEEVTGTGRDKATARKNLSRELQRRNHLPPAAAIKTIWDADAETSTEALLICAPTHADIQRMAGFPVDDEDRAIAEEDEAVRHGAETEPYTHAEAMARWEAWGGE
jgi:hypothetical protein